MPDGLPPRKRLIVLGASNVVLGLPVLLDLARAALGTPLEVLVACGFGRSYGLTSRVLGRGLPGIRECGLWPALAGGRREDTLALVLDVGNDLLYDVDADTLGAWIADCLLRLRLHAARIVLGGLPAGLERLSRRRYLFFRTLFFPPCRLSFPGAQAGVARLGVRLAEAAQAQGLTLAENRPEWYGLDPIHVRRRFRPAFWGGLIGAAPDALAVRRASGLLRLMPPERRTLLGFEQRRRQPGARLADGTTLASF